MQPLHSVTSFVVLVEILSQKGHFYIYLKINKYPDPDGIHPRGVPVLKGEVTGLVTEKCCLKWPVCKRTGG